MRKILLASLVASASALSVPAFAQLNLGGAAQVEGGAQVSAPVRGTLQTVDRVGMRADHAARQGVDHARRTSQRASAATDGVHANADVHAHANTSPRAETAGSAVRTNADVDARAELNPSATTHRAGDAAREVSGRARNATRSTLRSIDHTAGRTGTAARDAASAKPSLDAEAEGSVATHGH